MVRYLSLMGKPELFRAPVDPGPGTMYRVRCTLNPPLAGPGNNNVIFCDILKTPKSSFSQLNTWLFFRLTFILPLYVMIVKLRQNFTNVREFSQTRDQKKLCYKYLSFARYDYVPKGKHWRFSTQAVETLYLMIFKLRQNFTNMREFSQIKDQKKLCYKYLSFARYD